MPPRQLPQEKPSKFEYYGEYVLGGLDKLRPHQREAIEKTVTHFHKAEFNQIAEIVMATGAGKSGVIAVLPYALAAPKEHNGAGLSIKKVLVLAPSLVVRNQLHEAISGGNKIQEAFLSKRKIIDVDDPSLVLPTTKKIEKVEEVDTGLNLYELVVSNPHKFREDEWRKKLPSTTFQLVIVDEAHHLPSTTWKNVTDHFTIATSRIVFLTATPKRADQRLLVTPPTTLVRIITFDREKAVQAKVIRDVRFKCLPGSSSVSDPQNIDQFRKATKEVAKFVLELLEQKKPCYPVI